MANYINLINVGGTIYDIGMKNAVHFHGISKVSEFYNSAACTTHASNSNIGDDYLWTKGLSIEINPDPSNNPSETTPSVIDDIHLGCMVLLAKEDGAATSYEYICVEIISGEGTSNQIAKWAMMGEVTTASGTITTHVSTATGDVAVGVTAGKGDYVTAVSAEGAASAIKSDLTLSTASYTVITGTPVTATAHNVGTQTRAVVTGAGSTSVHPVTAVSISDGDVTLNKVSVVTNVSYTAPVASKGTVVTSVSYTQGSSSTGNVVTAVTGGSLTTSTGSLVTDAIGSVTTSTGSVVTSVSGGSISTTAGNVGTSVTTGLSGSSVSTYAAHVEDHTLVIDLVVTSVAFNKVATALNTGSVVTKVTHTAPTVASGTIVTNLSTSEASKATVLTKVSHVDISVVTGAVVTGVTDGTLSSASGSVVTGISEGSITTSTGSVATGVNYTKQTLTVDKTAAAITIITSVGTKDVQVVTSLSDVYAITSVPSAAKTVATAFGTKNTVPVISGISVTTAKALNSVSANTATVLTSITNDTGTVLTAAK